MIHTPIGKIETNRKRSKW